MSEKSVYHVMELPDAEILEAKSHVLLSIIKTIKKKGWNQKEASQELNIAQSEVSRLLNGRISRFSFETLLKLEIRLGKKLTLSQSSRTYEHGALNLLGF